MVGVINKNLKPKDLNIYLCKPTRQRIALLKEAKDINVNFKYNDTHEISFTLPYKVRKNNETIQNEHISLIRGRYLLEIDDDFYVIDKFSNSAESKREIMNVHAYHLPYELRDKDVRAYKDVKTIRQALTDTLLYSTNWKIGYIDGSLETQYRAFDVSQQTLLQFIYEMAEMFNAVLYWDSKNKTVSFYKHENLGVNKGLYISDKRYLKQIMESIDFDTVCTRLKCYGRNSLTFNDISPIGQNYIENFSAFMYPYSETITNEANDTYVVNSHSHYMSDGLCHAIIKYNKFVESKKGQFTTLLNQKDTLNLQYSALNNELIVLQAEYTQILDNLDIANANNQPTSDILIQKSAKETQISNKQDEMNTVRANLTTNQNSITALMNSLALQNHFTQEQILERNNYIIVREYTNNNIITAQDLYDAGMKALDNLIYPPVNITLDIVNFLKVVKCQYDWDKLEIGNIITLSYPNFGIHIEAKILGIQINYETNSINLEIGNYKRLQNDEDYLKQMLYKSHSTSTQVDMNKMWWEETQNNKTAVGELLNNIWDANARQIKAGINESIEIGKRGIIIKDPNDSMNYLVAQHGILAITNDNGNSWKNAITKNGIIGERIIGNIIAGEDLTITTQNGDFLVNQLGVQISNLTLSLTRSDNKTKVLIDATNGIKIQSNNGSAWEDALSFDGNGKGLFKGNINIQGSLKINGAEVLTENNKIKGDFIDKLKVNQLLIGGENGSISFNDLTDIPDFYDETEILNVWANSGYATYINSSGVYTGTVAANKILIGGANGSISFLDLSNKPFIPTKASDIGALPDTTPIPVLPDYIQSTYIDSTTIQSPTITGGLFRTTAINNNRIELTGSGLISYNSSNKKHGVAIQTGDFSTNYSRVLFYNANSMIGAIEASNSAFTLTTLSGSAKLQLYGGGGTLALGSWDFRQASKVDFTNVNVVGLSASGVAKFG